MNVFPMPGIVCLPKLMPSYAADCSSVARHIANVVYRF